MDETIERLTYLIAECKRHNSDYHHITPKSELDAAERLTAWLRELRATVGPTAHGEKGKSA